MGRCCHPHCWCYCCFRCAAMPGRGAHQDAPLPYGWHTCWGEYGCSTIRRYNQQQVLPGSQAVWSASSVVGWEASGLQCSMWPHQALHSDSIARHDGRALNPCTTSRHYSHTVQPGTTVTQYKQTLQPYSTSRHYRHAVQAGTTAMQYKRAPRTRKRHHSCPN